MKSFIYNEMMVHVPICTNKNPQNVLIISNDAAGLIEEIQKHDSLDCDVISDNIDLLRAKEDVSYDVVISEMELNPVVTAHINRTLKEDGLLVNRHPSLDEVEENKQIMAVLGKYAKIVMPYNLGDGQTALLASKKYHPTADIILQRTDMLDNLEYYNCDIHPAAFAMGNNVRREYLGSIKN